MVQQCTKGHFNRYKFYYFSFFVNALVYFFYGGDSGNLLAADSWDYLNFCPSTTMGYPIFLRIVQWVFGTYEIVPLFQLAIFAVSSAFLATQLESFFTSAWMAGIVLFCLLFNPELIKYHHKIMTESLSFSLVCLYLAFVVWYFESKGLRNITIAALIAGLAVLIRPINYTWLAGVGLLAIIAWRHHSHKLWKLSLLSFVPYGSVILLGCVIFFFKHGEFKTQSFLGITLYGKTMSYLDESVPTKAPHYMSYMAKVIMPMRESVLKCPSIQCRYALSAAMQDYIRRSMISDAERISAIKADFGPDYVMTDDFYMAIALEVLRAKPREFFEDVALHLFSLWNVLEMKTLQERNALREIVDSNASLKEKEDVRNYPNVSRVVPMPVVYGMRAGFLSICILSLVLIGAGVFTRVDHGSWAERMRFLAIVGVIIHAGYLGIALVASGMPRYILSFWPCMSIYGSFIACYLWQYFGQFSLTKGSPHGSISVSRDAFATPATRPRNVSQSELL